MPRATKRIAWNSWSGTPFVFSKHAAKEISSALGSNSSALQYVALCLGWYFEANEAESNPVRPVHHWLDLKDVLHTCVALSLSLKQLKPPTVNQLRNKGLDVEVALLNLRDIKRSARKVLKILPRESRGRSRKSAINALVQGLDWVYEHHVKRTASRRSTQQREFLELVLGLAEIEYEKLPLRSAAPKLPFDHHQWN